MRVWLLIPALLLGAPKGGDTRTVLNDARVLEAPKYWAKKVGMLSRGQTAVVLKDQGSWLQVDVSGGKPGYVPRSAFVDDAVTTKDLVEAGMDQPAARGPDVGAAQVSNAARGFSEAANAADVSEAGLADADKWVVKYQGTKDTESPLAAQLAKKMPGFLQSGHLLEGER